MTEDRRARHVHRTPHRRRLHSRRSHRRWLLGRSTGRAPASPTPDVALVRVTGTITTVDDDFDCDPQATIEFSRLISVHSHNPYFEVMVKSGLGRLSS